MMSELSRREAIQTVGGAIATTAFSGLAPRLFAKDDARQRIRVGQIGVGHAHASKISIYRESADYEVVGIVEPDAALRKVAESQAAYRDLPLMTEEQLLNSPGLQVVLVETRVRDLLNVAEKCVRAGKHIHLDKPAGSSLPHFEQVLRLAAEKKLLVQMGYMYRYNPGYLLIRDALKQGWLGEVFEVHTAMSKIVELPQRQEFGQFSGGIMFELGGHVMDLIVGVLGKPQKVTPYNRRSGRFGDSLLDNALAVLEYPKATATIRSTAIEVDGGSRRHFVACGTEGTIHVQPLDGNKARITLSKPHGEFASGTREITFPPYTRYLGDAVDMAKILRGEKVTDFPYDHDLAVQKALLEASEMPLVS